MRRAQRLRERREFAAVYRRGRRYGSRLLTLYALSTGRTESRVGLAVGAAVGKAVARNRLKRRLREALRSLPLAPGWDLVLSARRGAAEAEYQGLREALRALLARAEALRGAEEVLSL